MPDADPVDIQSDNPVNPVATPCRHLRFKGMYVYTDGQADASHDDGGTIFWCFRTMKSFGPDDEHVNRPDCRDADRSCYEPS